LEHERMQEGGGVRTVFTHLQSEEESVC
jgi:hypothetical protein